MSANVNRVEQCRPPACTTWTSPRSSRPTSNPAATTAASSTPTIPSSWISRRSTPRKASRAPQIDLGPGVVAKRPARPAGALRAPLRERHHAERPRESFVNGYTIDASQVTTSISGAAVRDRHITIPAMSDHTEWTRCVMDHDVDLVLVSTHTHALGQDTHIKLFDGTNTGDEIYANTHMAGAAAQAVHAGAPHPRRHRLRDRLPLLQRHRPRGRLGLPRQGRDVQPGPRLDPSGNAGATCNRSRQLPTEFIGPLKHPVLSASAAEFLRTPKSALAASRLR